MAQTLIAFVVGLALISLGQVTHLVRESPPDAWLLSPPAELKHFTLGYNDNVADSLWIRLIQDFDICDRKGVAVAQVIDSKTMEQKQAEAASAPVVTEGRAPKCEKGWPFRMLLAITELAPRFRAPWTLGAITLSVIGDDREGASIIFDRGLEQIKNDWSFTYRAAYHFLIEANQPEKAAKLLLEAGKQGAPPWVYSLAARTMTKEGQTELAESVLQEQIKTNPDPQAQKYFTQRLEEVRERIRESGKSAAP